VHNHQQVPSALHNRSTSQSISILGVVSDVRWKRPQQGRVKCNINTSFSQTLNRTCIGKCVRDDDNTFVLVKTVSFSPICPVSVGEALGLFYALEWLSDMGNVDFVEDSKITHDAFHSNKPDVLEVGHIISECKRLFTSHFTNSRWSSTCDKQMR
jgi:hypothetical protein